jgi:hypothetical protein
MRGAFHLKILHKQSKVINPNEIVDNIIWDKSQNIGAKLKKCWWTHQSVTCNLDIWACKIELVEKLKPLF